jgi:hypothetical protein
MGMTSTEMLLHPDLGNRPIALSVVLIDAEMVIEPLTLSWFWFEVGRVDSVPEGEIF